jgi:ADP-ribose pyrophosphatase YjhB (NUDIX family)
MFCSDVKPLRNVMERLFAVDVEKTVMVLAEDSQQAIRIAEREAQSDDAEFDATYAKEVAEIKDVPRDWIDLYPYSGRNQECLLTCGEIVEEYDLVRKEEENRKRVQEDTLPIFPPDPKPVLPPAVVVAIENGNGEFLLLYRTSPPYGWCLAGGKIDEGEDERTAAIREVKEETGLDVSENILKIGDSSSFDGRPISVFVALYFDEKKVSLSKEHTAYMWVSNIPSGVSLAGKTKDFLEMTLEM